MKASTVEDVARDGTVAEVKALIKDVADSQFSHEGKFTGYGIKWIQVGVSKSKVDKERKQQLIDQYIGLSGNDALKALHAQIAAQGEQIDKLESLVTAFLEATLKANPALAQQEKTKEATVKTPKRTLKNVLK